MSPSPSGTTVEKTTSRFRNSILIAGLLGGLLGGVTSFAASRLIKPATPPPPPVANQQAINEARGVVEALLAELKAGKKEEFIAHFRLAYHQMTEEEFRDYKNKFINARLAYPIIFGKDLDQFELLRETAASPDLIQFLYLERYERGGLLWHFILYRGSETWNLAYMKWDPFPLDAFPHG
jgi:hypothetical protein